MKVHKVQSQKPSSAMIKLALTKTTTGKDDPELPAEDKFIRVTSLRNCSPNKCYIEFKKQTHLNINYSEEKQAFMVELLQRNHY